MSVMNVQRDSLDAHMDAEASDGYRSLRKAVPGHLPPKFDNRGFSLKTHPVVVREAQDRLTNVVIPGNWSSSKQPLGAGKTRSRLLHTRQVHAMTRRTALTPTPAPASSRPPPPPPQLRPTSPQLRASPSPSVGVAVAGGNDAGREQP